MGTWSFLMNTFVSVTKDSYRICKKIIDYTLSILKANNSDAEIAAMETTLQPFVIAFNTAYVAWKSHIGLQKSNTSTLKNDLKLLSSEKIIQWDIKVQNVYAQTSSDYVAIFPNRRKPFQNGSQEDRKSAVSALSLALDGIASLAIVKTDVDVFLATLNSNYSIQKGVIGSTKTDSRAVEKARVAVCAEMFGVLGLLIHKYRNKPEQAAAYFDLETIRNHQQTSFKHNISGGETRLALTHTFETNDDVRLINRGTVPLRFALCVNENHPITNPHLEVPPNSEMLVSITDLGLASNRFLKVMNVDETINGKYTVILL